MKIKVVVTNLIDKSTFKAVSFKNKKHVKYGKYIVKQKKYLIDLGSNNLNVGDLVEIIPSRPISKRKKWVVNKV